MADKTKPLYKSTLVIWSREHPGLHGDVEDLAHKSLYGNDTYLSRHKIDLVDDPEADPDWDETDFFNIPDTGDEGWASEFPDSESTTKVETPAVHSSGVAELERVREDPTDEDSGNGEAG